MDSEKKIIGRCPFCGGNVVKTCKGYRCENNTGEHPSCVLNINAMSLELERSSRGSCAISSSGRS